jgi:hypothetical protein
MSRFINIAASLVAFCVFDTRSIAQKPTVIPPSPNAASFSKYGDIPVNLSRGVANFQIPIYTLEEGTLSFPISLDYNYSGYRPNEESGWVGRGWAVPLGVISRTVRGGRDEGQDGKEGYLTVGPSVRTAVENREAGRPYDMNFMTQIVDGFKDSEPDLFNFSVAGISGSFFFGTDGAIYNTTGKKLKIEYAMSMPLDPGSGHNFVGNTFTKWTITDEAGVKYIFKNAEYGWSLYGNEGFDKFKKTISSWYLSEIVGVRGESIKFYYTAPTDNYKRVQAAYSQRKTLPIPGIGSPVVYFVSSDNIGIAKNYSEEIFLSRISGNSWDVKFNSTRSSKLVNGENSYYRRLNQIEIRDSSSTTPVAVKQFDFTYNSSDDEVLDKLQEKNGSVVNQPYQFLYNNLSKVNLTYGIDAWGYYNGAPNSNLISEFGADRQASLSGTLMGALSSVTYPTKGSTQFDYELNTISYVQTLPYSTTRIVYENFGYVWRKTENGLELIQSIPLTLSEDREYEAIYSFDYEPETPPCRSLTRTGTLSAGVQSPSSFTPQTCIVTDMPVGGEISVLVKTKKEITVAILDVGGLRIKKISNYTSPTQLAATKEYFYGFPGDTVHASGVLADSIMTSYVLTKLFSDGSACRAQIWKSEPVNSLSLTPVFYSSVEERFNDQSNWYSFTDFFDYRDDLGTLMAGIGSRMFGPITSADFARGREKSRVNYRDIARLNKALETSTEISVSTLHSAPAIYVEHVADYSSPAGMYGNADPKEYYVKSYRSIATWIRQDSETVSDFGTNGSSPVIKNTVFTYANPAHRQVTKKQESQSDGATLETNYTYPLDYVNTPGKAPFITTMIDSNMISYPLQRTVILDKSSGRFYVDGQVNLFQVYSFSPPAKSFIAPYKTYLYNSKNNRLTSISAYTGTTAFESNPGTFYENLRYTHYDRVGNPLSLLLNNSDKISYVWSYKGQYPVAEIQNADNAQVLSALGGTSFDAMADLKDNATILSKINGLRTGLTNSLVTGYLYRPLVGMTQKIAPNGLSTYYTYDALQRLEKVKDNNNETVKSYKYNYATP